MFVIILRYTVQYSHVALTGLEFSFPLAAPFFTAAGIELNSEGWCYNNAGQRINTFNYFQEKWHFFWVPKPRFNRHSVDTLVPKKWLTTL